MQRKEAFNRLFSMGFDFEFYKSRSDRQKPRMNLSLETTEKEVAKLTDEQLSKINQKMKVLLIGENWCGDCANAVPVIAGLASRMDNWEFKIVGKDDIKEEAILDHYKTAGRMKIPVIVFADEDGDEVIRWSERPTRSYKLLYDLSLRRLPKEEYMALYKSMPELKTDSVAKEIFKELLAKAEHTAAMLKILPKKR